MQGYDMFMLSYTLLCQQVCHTSHITHHTSSHVTYNGTGTPQAAGEGQAQGTAGGGAAEAGGETEQGGTRAAGGQGTQRADGERTGGTAVRQQQGRK